MEQVNGSRSGDKQNIVLLDLMFLVGPAYV